MHQQTKLDNGLRVITSEIPHARSVSTVLFVAAGSRYESDDLQGASHYIEHMLFKGTEKRPTAKEISEAIEGIGGYINAETGKETVVYWDKVTRDKWLLALDVIADITLNPRFEAVEIEKERKVITEELSTLFDNPGEWVHVLSDETLWGSHPLGRDVGGTIESVAGLTREQLLAYRHQRYLPEDAVLAIAGVIPHAEAVEAVAAAFGGWRGANRSPHAGLVPPTPFADLALRAKSTEQTHVCIAVPGMSYVDPDRFALELLNIVLGGGMSSRLFLEIRERQGLAYDVHSSLSQYRDSGSVVIYAGVDPKQTNATIAACVEQIDMLCQTLIGEEELGRAKEFWKGRTLLGMESTTNIAWWYGNQELLVDEIMEVDEAIAQIEAVTAEHVRAVAAQLFTPDKLSLAVVGPRRSERTLGTVLRKGWTVRA